MEQRRLGVDSAGDIEGEQEEQAALVPPGGQGPEFMPDGCAASEGL